MTEDTPRTGLSRRQLLQAAGAATVGAAALGAATSSAQAAPATQPAFQPRGRLRRRPNFLMIVVDEQRYAPSYESVELQAWRESNLPGQKALRRKGFEFTHHHIMSTACQPSRASIFTGQYPSLHGVSQTSGAAKSAIEEDLYWLSPGTVPTMGSWFRAGGYDTYWKGKWHVSDADIYQPGSYNPLPSYTDIGTRDAYLEQMYLEAEMLEQYGFSGFIGPEPHGSNPLNSGSSATLGARGRDDAYAELATAQLTRLRGSSKPWLMVASFVNPHDITLWGNLTLAAEASGAAGSFSLANQLVGSNVPRDLFTQAYTNSAAEDLSTKPDAQASFVELYARGFQPLDNTTAYHRFYYQLQKEVDQHVRRLLRTLAADPAMYRDTIVLYVSDHGDVLGAHGGMFQKWHNGYDEMLRVPFVVHNPKLFPKAVTSDVLTSHADLLPTMLGLAGLDQSALARDLNSSHTQVRRLVGRDLSEVLLGERSPSVYRDQPVYFMTDDQVFRGSNAIGVTGLMYPPVVQPGSVETVVAYLPTGAGGADQRWKLSRYWDNPQLWTNPGVQDVLTLLEGRTNQPGTKVATTTVKAPNPTSGQVAPPADQWEMYNVTADPTEMDNLAGNPTYAETEQLLQVMLQAQRQRKRLNPTMEPWANGSSQQFPFVPS